MMRQSAITLRSIEIVSIDHSKRTMNGFACHQNRMSRAPRLSAAQRHVEPRWKFVELLINVLNCDASFKTSTNDAPETLLDISANHKDDTSKTSAESIIDRIIDNGFASRTNRLYLFQTAVPTTHACSQNEQSWGTHVSPDLVRGISDAPSRPV